MSLTPLRRTLARWTRAIAEWLDPAPRHRVTASLPRDPFFLRAVALVQHRQRTHAGGEAQRHQVYAQLREEFPDRSRDVGLVIELAWRDTDGE